MDAVFLDLPSPEKAIKHAYQVLKPKGRVCNFSPCIEQVQAVAIEMAKLGFYEIRTIECLAREQIVKQAQYYSLDDVYGLNQGAIADNNDAEDKKRKE
mmetsp:Transcript_23742/g.32347  ORF Transcript_23742/g.32347 Transcript_23742/m.32347 type:complete len:98 (+) Transcript_23742:518-811(+)